MPSPDRSHVLVLGRSERSAPRPRQTDLARDAERSGAFGRRSPRRLLACLPSPRFSLAWERGAGAAGRGLRSIAPQRGGTWRSSSPLTCSGRRPQGESGVMTRRLVGVSPAGRRDGEPRSPEAEKLPRSLRRLRRWRTRHVTSASRSCRSLRLRARPASRLPPCIIIIIFFIIPAPHLGRSAALRAAGLLGSFLLCEASVASSPKSGSPPDPVTPRLAAPPVHPCHALTYRMSNYKNIEITKKIKAGAASQHKPMNV